MKIRTLIQEIRRYYASTRRIGHTAAMIRGAQNMDDVTILASSHEKAQQIKKLSPRSRCISMEDQAALRSLKTPLAFDNEAIDSLLSAVETEFKRFDEWCASYQLKIEELTKAHFNHRDGLKRQLLIQGQNGNWNHDPYIHGMYNGMELALSQLEGRDARYKETPEKYLCDYEPEYASPKETELRKVRLIAETRRTAERMNRLNAFMGSDDFPRLNRTDKDLLYEQQRTMSTLLQIYGKRIERMGATFSHKDNQEEQPENSAQVAAYPPPESEWPENLEQTWQLLQAGEIVQEDDQTTDYMEEEDQDWKPVDHSDIGYKIRKSLVGHYRRPVQKYRMLEDGENIIFGDEYFKDGEWVKYENPTDISNPYKKNHGHSWLHYHHRRPVQLDHSLDEESTFHND